MIPQFAEGILTVDLPEQGLKAGTEGVVVDHTADGEAYIVEFFTPEGATIDVVFVEAGQLCPVESKQAKTLSESAAR
ncbi:MAG: DUF4926 domain-containing protein [Anaerolineaceae bacterium]|nr:DUF4926 domain-containing protein [Anaerolineaceae bacterium]MCY3935463.1 DUF4926 domain-containing protein [Chloroflexota bacterium]MCY4009138.1 DUF4926 domain-containing protein [Anaerolineaceae bacterium]MCY4106166.1 DUF4926 domain-containing protein [Chloroflexota bacterium]